MKVGETVTKSPKNMTAWGAFFDMGEGFEGLLHVEEMNLPDGNRSPTAYDCIKEGQQYEVRLVRSLGAMCFCHVSRLTVFASVLATAQRQEKLCFFDTFFCISIHLKDRSSRLMVCIY